MSFIRGAAVMLVASGLVLSGCASGRGASGASAKTFHTQEEGGISFKGLFGGKKSANPQAESGIGVNGYLWRATLDTLGFMPLASADPWGGVVITDWYSNPEKPDERFKATVYILDTRLRADALNVTVFKQVKDGSGGWIDSAASGQTETDLENSILTRARQLRLANAGG
jgi:hypothetical protein